MLFVNKRIKNEFDGVGVIFHVLNKFKRLLAGGFISQLGVFDADSFAKTLCNNIAGLNVDKLILKGRTARIDNKNFHMDTCQTALNPAR